MQSGLKFGNSLFGKHIQYFCNKMNVIIAAPTSSSSVTDTIEFVMLFSHPFQNAEGTVLKL